MKENAELQSTLHDMQDQLDLSKQVRRRLTSLGPSTQSHSHVGFIPHCLNLYGFCFLFIVLHSYIAF